jgi:hypothetical protein
MEDIDKAQIVKLCKNIIQTHFQEAVGIGAINRFTAGGLLNEIMQTIDKEMGIVRIPTIKKGDDIK